MSAAATPTGEAVEVQAAFAVHAADDDQAFATAASLIDGINALANLPDCVCDVRISVERVPRRQPAAR